MIHGIEVFTSFNKKMFVKLKFVLARVAAIASCVATILAGAVVVSGPAIAYAGAKSSQKTIQKGVIVTAFQQNWKSIAKECKKTYGPEGVKYVQVSPPQDHIKGDQWWTSYQPVSYKLNSKLGTEDEFKKMITTCKASGIGIIADAVINHTTGFANKDTVGVGGSKYDAANQSFPDAGYTKDDFHKSTENINTYRKAEIVWTHRLVGLLDLDTSNPHVQKTLGEYFAHMLKLGVAGFRVDAAKHMSPQDVKGIKDAAADAAGTTPDKIWWMQETIGFSEQDPRIQPDQYLQTGEVNEFEYSYRLRNYFYGSIENLKHITDKLIPSKKAAIFVTNWDTERDNASRVLTYKDGKKYELANAFMLAYPYGTPNVFSGYEFTKRDEGAPGATQTSIPDVSCAKDSKWQCTQRITSIRGMIGFYNAVRGTKVTNWQDDDDNNVAFSRGNKGFLAINNTENPQKVSYKTDLPDGEYCNVYESKDCTKTVSVSGGKVETTIAAESAVALHANAVKSLGNTRARNVTIFICVCVALICAFVVNRRFVEKSKKLAKGNSGDVKTGETKGK
ncbi:alpha-amylase family protein [Gardnerella vaginalis]|uniref:alpha-amylase n=1 Tax=Gardnerella vaginalis TaxID=2702 RepID=UPI00254FE8AB|nr:alpha-amylase family protein [Gardnerella vaginalis]MDK7259990.1 alpha-amylase family protein [Gardnerella vaginalis]MDK8776291.1 alpha-amylase family protein [Gardnerella vaginalis]